MAENFRPEKGRKTHTEFSYFHNEPRQSNLPVHPTGYIRDLSRCISANHLGCPNFVFYLFLWLTLPACKCISLFIMTFAKRCSVFGGRVIWISEVPNLSAILSYVTPIHFRNRRSLWDQRSPLVACSFQTCNAWEAKRTRTDCQV